MDGLYVLGKDDRRIIGKSLQQSRRLFPYNTFREVIVEGEYVSVIQNYDERRVNVATRNGFITTVINMG